MKMADSNTLRNRSIETSIEINYSSYKNVSAQSQFTIAVSKY